MASAEDSGGLPVARPAGRQRSALFRGVSTWGNSLSTSCTAGVLPNHNAGPSCGRPGAPEGVAAEDQVVVVAVDDDGAAAGGTVVEDAVVLEDVAVGPHRLALVAEQ